MGTVAVLSEHDPRQGPWHSAYAVCAKCLWSGAAVWHSDARLTCPECSSHAVATWADPPNVEAAFRKPRSALAEING